MFCINLNQMTSLSPFGEEETSLQIFLSFYHSMTHNLKNSIENLARTGFDDLNGGFSMTSLEEHF